VLEAQRGVREDGPEELRSLCLITLDELHEIRRLWLYEKHEFDDSLPRIYKEVTGEAFPQRGTDASGLRVEDWETLREVCGEDQSLFDLQVALLGVERQYRGTARRAGVYKALEERLRTGLFGTEQEAVEVLSERLRRRQAATQSSLFGLSLPVVNAPLDTEAEEQG
jgi:DNA sulfur modification protein DndC